MKMPDTMPHRMVDKIADGLINGIDNFGHSALNAVQGAGKAVMGGLDKPFEVVAKGREGPHRIVDRAADGAADTLNNFSSAGVVGSVKRAGEAVMKALDHPLEQIKK